MLWLIGKFSVWGYPKFWIVLPQNTQITNSSIFFYLSPYLGFHCMYVEWTIVFSIYFIFLNYIKIVLYDQQNKSIFFKKYRRGRNPEKAELEILEKENWNIVRYDNLTWKIIWMNTCFIVRLKVITNGKSSPNRFFLLIMFHQHY